MEAFNKKVNVAVGTMLMVIGLASRANAFPLPTMDIKGVMTQVQTYMTLVQEVQSSVTRTQHIIKEIQNGGFGAAVNDLFGMIDCEECDRFGNSLKTLEEMAESGLNNVQTGIQEFEQARQMRQEEASEEAIADAKRKLVAEHQRTSEEKQREKERIKEADTSSKQSAVSNTYNWLKGNKLVVKETKTDGQAVEDVLTNDTYEVPSENYTSGLATSEPQTDAETSTIEDEMPTGIIENIGQPASKIVPTLQQNARSGENILKVNRDLVVNPYSQEKVINTDIPAVQSLQTKEISIQDNAGNLLQKTGAALAIQPQAVNAQNAVDKTLQGKDVQEYLKFLVNKDNNAGLNTAIIQDQQ